MTTPKKRTGIRIPKHLDEELKRISEYLGYTKNGLIVQILNSYVTKQQRRRDEQQRVN